MIGKTNIKIKPNKKVQYVEYIESTGTQYIDTGVKPTQNTRVEIKFVQSTFNTFLYGSRTSSTSSDKHCFAIATGTDSYPLFNGSEILKIVDTYTLNTQYILKHDKDGCYLNDKLLRSYTYSNFSSNLNMYLFALNQNGSVNSQIFVGQIYYCKIWDNDTLVRDFRPAKSEDGRLCLFDKVERKYYYNKGTGNFIGDGYEDTKLNYLESTGTQYIDTGIEITPTNFMDLKMELDMTVLSQTNNTAIMGISGTDIDVYVGIKSSKWYYGNGLTDVNTNVASDYLRHTHIYDVYNLTYTRDDTKIQMSLQSPKSTGTIKLFSYDSDGTNTISGKFKIHRAKFYFKDELIKDYIPIMDYTGTKCFYENVERVYKYNDGTGTFGGA